MIDSLFQFLVDEANKPFSGWDFSYIEGTSRVVTAPLTWSYTSIILPKIRQSVALLDMGTGGGEFLSLLQPLPAYTCATEGYAPNIPMARERLEPLGVQVHPVTDDDTLPFPDSTFDLVINKHESYSPSEVWRILKPGGTFVTQQVGGDNDSALNRLLGAPLDEHEAAAWRLAPAVEAMRKAGFEIRAQGEAFPVSRFFDVGAVVYYLKCIPWQIPDFTVERYYPALVKLHERIQTEGYLDVPSHRFYFEARKP